MNVDLLKQICGLAAPPSREGVCRDLIADALKGVDCEIITDALGGLTVRLKGPAGAPKVMFACGIDQPGFIVNYIGGDGFMRFSHVGRVSCEYMVGQRVVFQNGALGVIACERLRDGQKMTANNLYIDAGGGQRAAIGDMCVFANETVTDGHKIISPGLWRAAAFILLETIKSVGPSPNDLYFSFAAQREVGFTGAKAAAYNITPDYAVAFGLTPSHDTPSQTERSLPARMGGGAALKVKDASVICNPRVVDFLKKTADEHNIPSQFEIADGFSSEAGVIHTMNGGVPSGGVSVPARHLETANPCALLSDIEACVGLAAEAARAPFSAVAAE